MPQGGWVTLALLPSQHFPCQAPLRLSRGVLLGEPIVMVFQKQRSPSE